MSSPADGSETEDLVLEIVEEQWNEYVLEDGSRIRARSIPGIVAWPKKDTLGPGETLEVGARFIQVIIVIAPRSAKGAPNPRPPSIAEAQKIPLQEVRVVKATEPWNTYRFSGREGTLSVRTTVRSIFRVVDVFDANGDPYYVVNSTVAIGPSRSNGSDPQE
jgi:hypothetical protein